MTPLLARELIGRSVRDRRGRMIGRLRDVGFVEGAIVSLRTERGVFAATAREGLRLVAGERERAASPFLGDGPRLEGTPGGCVRDLVLGEGLSAPLYVVSRGLWHDLLHGRDLVPAARSRLAGRAP